MGLEKSWRNKKKILLLVWQYVHEKLTKAFALSFEESKAIFKT